MLVRSASTPILGALHPSGCHSPAVSVSSPAVHFPESPASAYHPPSISCHLSGGGGGSDHERLRGNGAGGMRRTSSEGNIASLAGRADDHHLLPPSGKCAPPRARPTPLETIQSFTNREASTDDEEEDEEDAYAEDRELSFGQFSFVGSSTYSQEHPLFLARGLGIDRLGSGLLSAGGGGGGIGGGDGGGTHLVTSGGNGGDRSGIEMHYKKMIEEDPCNGLFLRNYAQFLYQVKGDYRRAEEYYSRAILVDPNDGELLSEYAKLVWDVHGDEERASSYFEQAARASPQNSHVLAAHAAFLWDTDDSDGPEDCSTDALGYAAFAPARSSLASATT